MDGLRELTNALLNGTIPDPLWPPLPRDWGFATQLPLLSQERVKLRTSNFTGTFIGSIRTKAHENIGNSSHGRSQGVPKIFRAPICREHCAVIFAIAQLFCCFFLWRTEKTKTRLHPFARSWLYNATAVRGALW